MRIISFDVGIKNMAYCIFDISLSIIDWNVINLMDQTNKKITCNCILKKSDTVCGKSAKYYKNEETFCEKHAKISKYKIPDREHNIKKMKLNELINYCNSHFITMKENSKNTINKNVLIDEINNYNNKHVLEIIKKIKEKKASDIDLISIGRNIRTYLNKIPEIDKITHVIIENQISPIANRMKTIQGMLAQYYIMSGSPNIHIEFVSSLNKLKGYDNIIENNEAPNTYKQHKKDSVIICNHFLENNENLKKWKPLMDTTKKDDLADCFLQCIWYLKNKKIITNADNLKITNL